MNLTPTSVILALLIPFSAPPIMAQRDGLVDDEEYFNAISMADEYLEANDYENAFIWLGRSARYGDKSAQHQLALLYLNGLGTDVDYALAYAWAAVAAESKSTRSRKLRTYLAGLFNEQQLVIAERIAAGLIEQYGMDAMDIVCRKKFLQNSGRKRVQCYREHMRQSKYQPPSNVRW